MNRFVTTATSQVTWPVSAPNQVWRPTQEVLPVILFAVIVANVAISALTVFLSSSASIVVEGATKLINARPVECLNVAYIGIDQLVSMS